MFRVSHAYMCRLLLLAGWAGPDGGPAGDPKESVLLAVAALAVARAPADVEFRPGRGRDREPLQFEHCRHGVLLGVRRRASPAITKVAGRGSPAVHPRYTDSVSGPRRG